MSNPTATARARLLTALGPLEVPVHTRPPGATQAGPFIVIRTGDRLLGAGGHVDLEVRAVVYIEAEEDLEQLMWDAMQLVAAAGFSWGDIPAPVADKATQSLTTYLPVTLRP